MAPSFGRSDAVVTSSVDFGENLGLTKRADNRDVGATGMWYLHGTAVWTLRCGTRVYAGYRSRRVKSNEHKTQLSLKLKTRTDVLLPSPSFLLWITVIFL